MALGDETSQDFYNALALGQERVGIISGCVVGSLLLLITSVAMYVCCIGCKKQRRTARKTNNIHRDQEAGHIEIPELPYNGIQNQENNAEDDVMGSGLNLSVPVPLVRRESGYNNNNKSDLQPIVHRMPSNATEKAMEKYSINEKRLKLDEVIGRGTFALVYNGRLYDKSTLQTSTKYQQVTAKTVHGPECTPMVLEQFVGDGLILRSFKHPHVHSVHGLVIKDDQPYILSPKMTCGDLRSYITSHTSHFTVRTLIQMGRHVAEGLKYLGEQGFVHQDIAARNCLVDGDGNVKVSDYALSANMFEDDYFIIDELSDKPLPIGWMAPETLTQLMYSLETDVWSFGVLLWELLTRGHAPFSGMDGLTIIAMVRTGQRLEKPAVAPAKLYELMSTCWKEDPRGRPTISFICESLKTTLQSQSRAKQSDYRRVIDDSKLGE